jgi:hypothetical protein
VVKPYQLLGLGVALGVLAEPTVAFADQSLNPALGRLVLDHRCNNLNAGDGSSAYYIANAGSLKASGVFNDGSERSAYAAATGRDSCTPDNVAFAKLINQWGFALAPTAMHTARTTGFGGFQFSLEAVYTKIASDQDYWKLGSEGPRDPSSDRASVINSSPPGVLQAYSLRIRKSFGFGLEVGTQVGYVPSSTILTGGADARLALLEGFRTGFLGILPDISVGAGVRTVTGTPEFQLTTVGLDVQISKPLTLGGQSVLSPWIGYQYLWIFGDSGLIDTTPATDAVGYCQSTGSNVPGNADPTKALGANGGQVYDGQPVCAGGSPIDFNNNVVFNPVRLHRQRMMFGLDYRYEMVSLGAEFITDLVAPADAQSGGSIPTVNGKHVSNSEALQGQPRQWSLVFQLGANF